MSQINRRKTSGPPGGNVQVVTDDGTIISAGGSFNLNGESSSEDNPNGITTKADPTGSQNGEVVLTNRLTGTATSTNGSVEDIVTFDLGAVEACYRFSFMVAGRDTATGDGVGYSVDATVKTDGATASLVAAPYTDNDEDPSLLDAEITVVASANNAILQATGVTGQTIAYKAVGQYVVV